MKKYNQIFLKKDDGKEALKECYSEPFMTTVAAIYLIRLETKKPRLESNYS